MKVVIPKSPEELGGPCVDAGADAFRLVGRRDTAVVIIFHSRPAGIDWFDDFDFMYGQEQHDRNIIKVIRKASDEELKLFRVPVWIQDEEIPECCGQPMHFVGQIDDDDICQEAPDDAKLWWHDVASFYVFTCSKCLECKAVGQQY